MNETEPSPFGPELKACLGVALAIALYVLSIGPVALFCEKTKVGEAFFQTVYRPVFWLHDHTPMKKPLEAYVRLFGLK